MGMEEDDVVEDTSWNRSCDADRTGIAAQITNKIWIKSKKYLIRFD